MKRRWLQLANVQVDADRAEETPEGYLVVPATLARVGVLEYHNPDGSIRRELRSEGSVFGDMDRLGMVPVTALHPRHNTGEPIAATAANYRAVTVGHVLGGSQKRDGDYLRAKLVIQDAATVAAIKRRELPEVSMGYIPTREERPGNHNGEDYDVVQTAATYNHVALVPTGRAGPNVRLHIDSAGGDAFLERWQTGNHTGLTSHGEAMKFQIINGKSYEVGTPEHQQALEADAARRAEFEADARRKDEQIATLTKERDELQGERDALKLEVDSLKSVDHNALVRERATILADAQAAGVTVTDDMDNAAVRRAIVEKRRPDLKIAADASDEYVSGILRALGPASQAPVSGGGTRQITNVTEPPTVDSAPTDNRSDARREQTNRLEGKQENR